MGYQRGRYQDTWEGLAPEQPAEGRGWLTWLAAGIAALLLACICLSSTYLVAREFLLAAPTSPPPPPVPTALTAPGTAPVVASTATLPASPAVQPTATIAIAPTVTLPGQATLPPAAAGNVEAVRLPAAPVIDGALTEWGGAPTYASSFRVFHSENWDATEDLTAVWRLAWDQNNLYIGVEVTDNVHVQTQTGNLIYRGDSLEMQFDTNRTGDYGNGVNADDFHIIFSPGDFATLAESAFRFQGTSNGSLADAPGHNVAVQAQRTPAGYVLEAAIPWRDINVTPSEGLIIGIA
ncbi:MAG: hypothetical protein L0331_03440, partial [Chloroflexi bacterium]|nr:hypothetical protein [Chloroflexota bacterium]